MRNQSLLKTLDECEYPADFLVARLLGKKGALFRNWEFLITGSNALQSLQDTPFYPYLKKYAAPGIWRFLRNEHLWIYRKMNPHLRENFTSYFVYHEINILIVCLRHLHTSNEIEPVLQELQSSLLHNDIQDILTSGFDFTALLRALEACLCTRSDLFMGLSEHYEIKGLTALEVFIRNSFFAFIISQNQPLQLKSFIQYMIDFHNCISLAKSIRWQMEAEPTIIQGGVISHERFKRAYFQKDMMPILRILHLKDYKEADSTVQQLETALLKFITRKLKRDSYQRTVTGDILFYLWEQYCYTRNISMILNTFLLDDEPVRENIVA